MLDFLNLLTLNNLFYNSGIQNMMKNGSFVVFLILFEDVLTKINILSNQLQHKKATLGKAVTLINGVIKTFEVARCDDNFKNVWTEIVTFCNKSNISLEIGV